MFIILIFTCLIAFFVARQWKSRLNLPKGPIPIPVLGNALQLMYQMWRTGGLVPALKYFRTKYGSVFTLWLGPFPTVHIADPHIAHEVMVKNGTKYMRREAGPILEYFRNGYGVFASNGEIWQEQRRFTLHVLRDFGVGRDLMEVRILDELNARFAELDRDAVNGVTVRSANKFFDLTVGSIINNMLFSERFDENDKKFEKLKELLSEAAEAVGLLEMMLPIWVNRLIFGSRFQELMDTQIKLIENVSVDAKKRLDEVNSGARKADLEHPQDYVEAYIAKIKKDEQDGVKSSFNFEALKIALFDLWITGQDTTSITLHSAVGHLVNNPHVVKTLREELLSVTDNGARHLSLSDRNHTPYLNATVQEVQRHASILNGNFFRLVQENTVINGQPVEAGALITAQLSLFHVDDDLFENPKEFDPSRFIRNKKLNDCVAPFGFGKRSCLGESLARAELYLILGNIILRYDLQPHGKMPDTSEECPMSFSKRPRNFDVKFVKM